MMLPAILILLSLSVLADTDVLDYTDNCEWMQVEVCHIAKGKAAGTSELAGHTITGKLLVRKEHIIEIVPLKATKECVMVFTNTRGTVAVVGSYTEILDKLNSSECPNKYLKCTIEKGIVND